jgi:molybdopterin-guanine dinucleotide biosynthesis protein MobB
VLLIAVHFLGYKNSGKTTTIQQLTSHFVAHGKRVGVLKHIHKEKLELSARFKDTQRFLDAGAQTVCALSRNELVFYLRERTLDDALELLKSFPLDFLFIEGYSTNERFFGIKCVVCAKSVDEAISLIDIHRQKKNTRGHRRLKEQNKRHQRNSSSQTTKGFGKTRTACG